MATVINSDVRTGHFVREERMRGHISLTNKVDKTFAMGQIVIMTNDYGSWITLSSYDQKSQIRDLDTSNMDIASELIRAAKETYDWVPLVELRKIGVESDGS